MANMSDFLENKLIDWLLRAQAIGITGASAAAGTGPANVYIGLFTTSPADAGGGVEVSGGSYARQARTSSLANWAQTSVPGGTLVSSGIDGTTSNNGVITFPAPTANWGVVTSIGIFDAVSAGNLLFWAALALSKTINSGDAAPSFAAAALTIQIDT